MRNLSLTESWQVAGSGADYSKMLSDHFGSNVEIHSIEPTMWNNSGMGCGSPNDITMQVITHGAVVHATVNGVSGVFHMSESGRMCSPDFLTATRLSLKI